MGLATGEGEFPREAVYAAIQTERNPNWVMGDAPGLVQVDADIAFIRTPRWRYVMNRNAKTGRLADMENDPWEIHNLAHDQRELALRLREDLLIWRERMLLAWARTDPRF